MLLILLSVLAIGQIAALTTEGFRKTLHKECFDDPLKWEPKSAVSMENFIYTVEKLERSVEMSTEELVRMLLRNFSCNRLKLDESKIWIREDSGKWFESIVQQFLNNGEQKDVDDSFTKEDKCQMFFMLSPTIQKVEKDNSGNEDAKFYEPGVVSLNADEEQAIDLSKVLYGILAGFLNEEKPIKEFRIEEIPQDYADAKLDPLFSLTISEIINTVKSTREQNGINNKRRGKWTSTTCTKEYAHDTEQLTSPTIAEIVGAIDGFILGSKIKKMANKDVKLSQILRMYYTQDGFKENMADQFGVSYCNRIDSYNKELTINRYSELEAQTLNYMVVYQRLSSSTVLPEEETDIRNKAKQFHPENLRSILQKSEAEENACSQNGKKEKGDICETPSNIFVILDKRRGLLTELKSIVGKLIHRLNIGLDEDTITIYSNMQLGDLQRIVNASDSKAFASCTLEDYNENGALENADDSNTLREIQNILNMYEENQKSLPAVPAKVVVYFNFGESKVTRELNKAKSELRMRHPYLTMIPIGTDKEYLREYFTNNQPSRMLEWVNLNLVSDLKKSICKAPAVLQYMNCKTKSKYQDTEYTDYIRELHVRHWAMYPKDFLKTFSYKFRFEANIGKIRVCFSREQPIEDSGNSSNCRETTTETSSIEFTGSDPCKDRTVHNCNPFYFSVFGRDNAIEEACSRELDGKNIGCKRLDQIKYTVKHEGISCSSAKQLISLPLFQTLLTFFVTFYVLTRQK